MTPGELKPDQFSAYPPQAQQSALAHMALLRQLPLAFVPLLLRELISYDWKFPAERKELDHQFAYLTELPPPQLTQEMAPFLKLQLSPNLEHLDWINSPTACSEQLASHLWSTHQLDDFRAASIEYVRKLNASAPPQPLPMSRLGIVIIGRGVTENQYQLFRKLRPYGTYFSNVHPENGRKTLFEAMAERAQAQPPPKRIPPFLINPSNPYAKPFSTPCVT